MKKAIVYGAGNIGRGFIGQLFSKSGYEVVFFDINALVINRLNQDHCYSIRTINNDRHHEEVIDQVRAVDSSNINAAINEIKSAGIMALAIGVNALPGIVEIIAAGLTGRWETGNFKPFNIIICENLLNAKQYLEELIIRELATDKHHFFWETVGLVEASVGRMVPVVTSEMQQDNPLLVCVEEYCELPVDKDAFKGEIPEITNMKPFSPFSYYVQRKLYMHNMAHCLAAYMGSYKGIQYMWEACNDSTIKLITLRALFESSLAISEENGFPAKILYEHAEDLLSRFADRGLGDTVVRVGRDPVRKLSKNDRLIGAGLLCQKYGIKPVFISVGIAAGFVFAPIADELAFAVQERISKNGIASAISDFCEIDVSNDMFGMIVRFYEMLKHGASLEEIMAKAERINNKNQINAYNEK